MKIKRRTWMKAAAAAIASAALPGCKPQVHKLVPYLLPDDEIVPGVADWYASTCGECSAGCGVLVRTMEGRAKKIEGNPEHPVSQGKLCARGQAAVQSLYHPDRLREPRERNRKSIMPGLMSRRGRAVSRLTSLIVVLALGAASALAQGAEAKKGGGFAAEQTEIWKRQKAQTLS